MSTTYGKEIFLETELAKKIYKENINIPVFNYHSHLTIEEIKDNTQYKTITELWLANDHYKWKLMRVKGYSQEFIMDKSIDDFDKFLAFIKAIESQQETQHMNDATLN